MRDGHFYRFGGRKGASDIFILKGGKLYAVELKVGKNKLSLEQMEFLADIERNGGVAIVARNLEDVEEKLK
jgi:predicted RecB family endonuclease